MKLITKKLFYQIFTVQPTWKGGKFVRVVFNESIIYVTLTYLYKSREAFKNDILRIGFVNYSPQFDYFYRLKILPEYEESIKNLFDLALSEIQANKELAFQMFQNIREYAIIEEQQSIPVPKYVERVIDYSKIQLGGREYSEKEIQYLMKDAKKTQKKEPNQLDLFVAN